ncbi:hypothetical protein AB0K12_19780 [Nonomuraea sp. NPDC049419]|uniref:hypothetical protein n=1 Tax=Nonomuraea sp. NPDC049419 TaxID=3155772 RepID=UPI003427505B
MTAPEDQAPPPDDLQEPVAPGKSPDDPPLTVAAQKKRPPDRSTSWAPPTESPPSYREAPPAVRPVQPPGQEKPGEDRSQRRIAILTGVTVPIVLAVIVFVATVVAGPFQEDVKEGVSAAEPPVRVGIEESWNEDVDMGWVFDEPLPEHALNELRNLPSTPRSVIDFAAANGGIRYSSYCLTSACDAARTRFKLSLTGRRRGEVRITDVVGRVLERRKPPTGFKLRGPTGGAEEIEPGILIFDASSTMERLRSVDESGRPGRAYFDEKFVYLTLNEPIVFEVLAVSSTWDIDWELVVKVIVDGKPGEMIVRSDGTPAGKPFRNPGKLHEHTAYQGGYMCEVGAPSCEPMRGF